MWINKNTIFTFASLNFEKINFKYEIPLLFLSITFYYIPSQPVTYLFQEKSRVPEGSVLSVYKKVFQQLGFWYFNCQWRLVLKYTWKYAFLRLCVLRISKFWRFDAFRKICRKLWKLCFFFNCVSCTSTLLNLTRSHLNAYNFLSKKYPKIIRSRKVNF